MIAERFVGGLNVPTKLGRLNATWPLATLTIDEHLVTLEPSVLRHLIRARVSVAPTAIKVAYKLKGRMMTPGVGLDLTDGRTLYFWTWANKDRVLDALSRQGVRIDPLARRASAIWPWRSPRRSDS
jgi:hypothetical protein